MALELVQGLAALRLPERPTVGAGSGDGGRLTRFLRSPAQETGTDKRRKFGFLGMTKYATGLTGGNTTQQQRRWGPTSFGRLFTSTADWSLSQDSQTFILEVAGVRRLAGELSASDFKVRRGVLWSTVDVALPSDRVLLDGIPNESAAAMLAALEAAQMHRAFLLRCDQAFTSAAQWAKNTEVAISEQLRTRGWLTQTFKAERNSAKPRELMALLQDDAALQHLAQQPAAVQQAVAYWKRPFDQVADEFNDQHLKRERHDSREFFERVEKSPLTAEQVDAVVCFDNRVLLVASAGSGKTSTMVAKAGYALHKGYFGDGRLLLLAFNNDAAKELRERIEARLSPLELPVERVSAKTFHAFGLEVIGAATGKRPSVAPWVESGRDQEMFLELVDELKDQNQAFRTNWDMFRLVLGQDLPAFGKEAEAPDSWDRATSNRGFSTLCGEVVKSRGEMILADWLFYNGVEYRYETPYKYATATPDHQQYRPDFYFPQVDAYLEHWALDENGQPPAEFVGYAEGMEWKRNLHKARGTRLLETTAAELWTGKAFQKLANDLTRLGITLDPNPDRAVPGRKPIENGRLIGTFRTFLTHAKSNLCTMKQLRARLESGAAGNFRHRHEVFLSLFEPLWAAWESKLRDGGYVDFDDMLNIAADCIESGQWTSPYELVMVDEFQDVSQARARLIKGLMTQQNRCLFGVGDDWQGINRFAGADISVMTDFERLFGKAKLMKLQTTFRCPQSLCDISSGFVQKNPRQLKKVVRSALPNVSESVRVVCVKTEAEIGLAVRKRIEEIQEEAIAAGQDKTTVYLMGRYNFDRQYAAGGSPARGQVTAQFITAHASKGLEADHVIMVRVTSDVLGFPSKVADDPVLQLAMPSAEEFAFAEERRLFYVALTRARKSVTMVTLDSKQSAFIVELVKDYEVSVADVNGEIQEREVCPRCGEGFMVPRNGKYGPFLSCNRFPACKHTRNLSPSSPVRSGAR